MSSPLLRVIAFACVCGFVVAPARGQDSGSGDTAGKVWNNDNIKTVGGRISVVGGSDSSAAADAGQNEQSEFAMRSNGARSVSPAPGETFAPGDSMQVEFVLSPGVRVERGAGLMTRMHDVVGAKDDPPFSFNVTIPENEGSENLSLIGPQPLFAIGAVEGGSNDPVLAETYIDVEERGLPVSMYAAGSVVGSGNQPTRLQFFGIGQRDYLGIFGRFANGHEMDITRSTHLRLTSGNPAVVRVDDADSIFAIGPGSTSLIATYTVGAQQQKLMISATVAGGEIDGSIPASPNLVDFGDVAVGTTSAARTVTITNKLGRPLPMEKLTEFFAPETCSGRTLADGESCTITVRIQATVRGANHNDLYIENSHVLLLCNGV